MNYNAARSNHNNANVPVEVDCIAPSFLCLVEETLETED